MCECRNCKERKELLKEIEELKNDVLDLTRENRQIREDKAFISDLSKKESAMVREIKELKRDVISLTRENRELKAICEKLNALCETKISEMRKDLSCEKKN